MSSKFKNTAAILAIVVGLGGAALAQTSAQTAATTDITAETLPEALMALNLTDIQIDQDDRHVEVEGSMADGTKIDAKLDPAGDLRMIEAGDDAALPASVIEALVPEAVRSTDIFAQFATIGGIGLPPAQSPMAGVMVMGTDADGEQLRAAFAEDGTLTRFGRGEEMRGDHGGDEHGMRGGKGGKGGRGGHGDKDHDRRGDGPGEGNHGMMRGDHAQGGEMMQQGGMMGNGMGNGQPPAPLDAASVTTILTEAGYTDLGSVTQDGPRTIVEAVNAAGEAVTVTLNPRGEVMQETAR